MKSFLFLLALAGLVSSTARAVEATSSFASIFGPAMDGTGTVIIRIDLEKRNGVDMRENVMLKDLIASLEKEGASVRPERKDTNVSFWIFEPKGYFVTCDIVNNPEVARYGYAKLKEYFADAPHDGPKWNRSGEDLMIGRRFFSVRVLPANDPATGGKKGEVEIAVLDGEKKVYYYFGTIVRK